MIIRVLSTLVTILVALTPVTSPSAPADFEQVDVFTSGEDGYAVYRIPAILLTTSGTLLAFAEGRMHGRSDHGRIDLVLKRSADGGRKWSPMQVVWSDGANTCGNPAPVLDRTTGRIWLLTTWNRDTDVETKIHDGTSSDTRRVFVHYSDDDGRSWSGTREITTSVKASDWRWYATGPCHAVQLRDGRLVIPANHSRYDGKKTRTSSHAIFSDDHGATWRASAPVGGHTNESTIAELDDGRLYINMRSYRNLKQRAVAWSDDRGETWSDPENEPTLIEPVCQGSVLRYPREGMPSLYFFSNPASTKREKLTVRTSFDQCKTWNTGFVVCEGPAAYSDLCPLPDGGMGVPYERNSATSEPTRLTFARLPLDLLLSDSRKEKTVTTPTLSARQLSALPDAHGFAGAFAGRSNGSLLVAGGANFPGKKPWEGGKKVWHDTIYALENGSSTWTLAGRLPRPLAYGVSLSITSGVLCIGGDDEQRAYADVFLMQRRNDAIAFTTLPSLPEPCSNACGAVLGDQVYVLGGTSRPGATAANNTAYVLDVTKLDSGWQKLPPWDGPARMLATAAVVNGKLYVCGGVDLSAGQEGKPVRTYLTDAHGYDPANGWSRIADLPRAATAAASPAPAIRDRYFAIIGGDDGSRAALPAGPDHPGFVRSALYYDAAANVWIEQPYDFETPVTLTAVRFGNEWILPSGESRPGIRIPTVIAIRFIEAAQ